MNRYLLACAVSAAAFLATMRPAWAEKAPSPVATAAMQAFWWGDFAALEKQEAGLKQAPLIAADGMANLTRFREGLERVLKAKGDREEPYLRELEALTQQWATEHPQSSLAHVLHAAVLVQHGWSYRGGGYVKEVPPQAWSDFEAYLRRAVEYLNAHADVALGDSYAHVTLLIIGKGLGWDDRHMEAILQDGLKRNPHDVDLYFERLSTLLPKWGGDARVLDRFIRKAAEQTKADYGMGMYSWLYASASINEYGHGLFAASLADWPTMKQGFEDLHARYPDSRFNRNRFAYMACLAKDKATLRALLAELGARVDASEWGPNPERSLEGCQRWAAQEDTPQSEAKPAAPNGRAEQRI